MPGKACNPPCASSRCYGCNAAARDLGLAAKAQGKKMYDLPEWAQVRIRRMVASSQAAQNYSQALSDAHEGSMAQKSYASAMRANDTNWRCAGCGNEQDVSILKYIHAQRRYCPTCALAFERADVARMREAAQAKAIQEAIANGNPLLEIRAKGKANWTSDERIALVSAKLVCVHCSKAIRSEGALLPGEERASGPVQKHCHACYMAREYGEQAAAQASKKSAEGIASVAATLAQNDPAQVKDNGPARDRFELIELEESAPAEKKPEEVNPNDRFSLIELE